MILRETDDQSDVDCEDDSSDESCSDAGSAGGCGCAESDNDEDSYSDANSTSGQSDNETDEDMPGLLSTWMQQQFACMDAELERHERRRDALLERLRGDYSDSQSEEQDEGLREDADRLTQEATQVTLEVNEMGQDVDANKRLMSQGEDD